VLEQNGHVVRIGWFEQRSGQLPFDNGLGAIQARPLRTAAIPFGKTRPRNLQWGAAAFTKPRQR
jgi:hypothetical protein